MSCSNDRSIVFVSSVLLSFTLVMPVLAMDETFTATINTNGQLIGGGGTGYGDKWYYYPNTDWWNQWFDNFPFEPDRDKEMTLSIVVRPYRVGAPSWIEVAFSWSTDQWQREGRPPLPSEPELENNPDRENELIERYELYRRNITGQTTIAGSSLTISEYCPTWASIGIRGSNVVIVEGGLTHACLEPIDPLQACCLPDGTCVDLTAEQCKERGGTPQGVGTNCLGVDCPRPDDGDFGDAPEGNLAYPDACIVGRFPTCKDVGSATWIQHKRQTAWFGPSADRETDGNAGLCPLFNPDTYNQDECFGDGDGGLLNWPTYTIMGPVGGEFYWPCAGDMAGVLGVACGKAWWGDDKNINLEVHNHIPGGKIAFVNILVDWNRDGQWSGASSCPSGMVPEHALVNFPISNPFDDKLSTLVPPPFDIGPLSGYFWARFSITEKPVPADGWDGSGVFEVGETEDYLVYVRPADFNQPDCDWQEGDPHKMHWPQMSDLSPDGTDVDMYPDVLADDFLCTESGPIRDIHFWASFKDDCLPRGGVDSVGFEVVIYADVPAGAGHPYSHPGKELWSDVFNPGEYTVSLHHEGAEGWYDPSSRRYQANNHFKAYQYNFCPEEPFVQTEGTVYWLQIRPIHWFQVPGPATPDFLIGWKTTPTLLQWNDAAVWKKPNTGWVPLTYPTKHTLAGQSMDLAFVITGGGGQPYNTKWSQTPIERNPLAKTPIFCGWDEPAYASQAAGADVTVWKLVADDFRCFGSMPVTSIRWWGSYLEWDNTPPPSSGRPSAWHIIFWNNNPPDNFYDYSRPSGPLWQVTVPAERVSESYAGFDAFPGKPTDTCFQYAVELKPDEYFRQEQYLDRTQENVFWMSITARYPDNQVPTYPWGWKTRPQPWLDNAIRITIQRNDIGDNVLLVPGAIEPIESSQICQRREPYDLAFELGTDSGFIKWEQPFSNIRHWPYYEGEKSQATAVSTSGDRSLLPEDIVRQVADDFPCMDSQPITAAVWWGSYIGFDYAACVCEDLKTKPIQPSYFLLSLWTDHAENASGAGSLVGRPGEKIWEYRAYDFDEVLVGYNHLPNATPASPGGEPVFRYSTAIPKEVRFTPKAENHVCWFGVAAVYEIGSGAPVYAWGWTNHAHVFGRHAVAYDVSDSARALYTTLKDVNGVGEDMAFMLFADSNQPPDQPYQPTTRPTGHTYCPSVETLCPQEETRCPSVISICKPGTPTLCPAMDTQCPEQTRCPVEDTQCYIVHTLCPGGLSDPTQCPPVETSCPPEDTRCPRELSRCRVCIVGTVDESVWQVWRTPYVNAPHSHYASLSAKQPPKARTLYERACPIVEATCLTLP